MSKSVRDNIDWMRPLLSGAPRLKNLSLVFASRCRVARLAPRWSVATPSVKRVLRFAAGTRNPFFRETAFFFRFPGFSMFFTR